MQLTSFAPVTSLLWKYMGHCDIDPAPIFLKAGIDPALISNPNARIDIELIDKLWTEAVTVIDDPTFGVKMVEFWHPSMIGALGYTWLVSSTLRRAMRRVDRYIHAVSEGLETKLEDTPAGLRLSIYIVDSVTVQPQQHTLIVAVLMHMCRFNFGDDLVPTKVCLARPEPADVKDITDYFRTDVQFDAEVDSLTIARADADSVLSSANKEIALMHDEILMKYLVVIKKGDIVQQVQSIILDNLPDGQVTDKLVASELNLSERSMQRRLKEHKTTFRFLLDGVREMVAKQYIENPVNRMSDIAFLLGFSEQSAFSRAFKKWTGKSPVEYRNSLN
ncbi:MAG: AraC family transcriptional regulator [Gammaproteobacteria bacterium]|nr:AraC family transcriptional regulator [Gammaproteobacteria bacterium]